MPTRGKSGTREDDRLTFAGHLTIALGRGSLAETLALPAAEFAFWADYRAKYGFPADRLEAATALAGAYICRAANPGSKVEPKDLIPKFGRRNRNKELAGAFAGIPGAKVERRERKKPDTRAGAG